MFRRSPRPRRSFRILIAGLDQSGKTTLLLRLLHMNNSSVRPTTDMNRGRVEHMDVDFVFHDVSGHVHSRGVWSMLIYEMDALVFVVDPSNPDRFDEASDALREMYCRQDENDEWTTVRIPLLVLSSHRQSAVNVADALVSSGLSLSILPRCDYTLISVNGRTGANFNTALSWLFEKLVLNDPTDW